MPFLLLDDAAQDATRRLQAYGQSLLQPLEEANQPPFAPGGAGTQAVQGITQRLQDFGQQQLQSLVPQAPTIIQPQPQGGLQDITRRLQTFGSQQLQNAQQAQAQVLQQLEPLNRPPLGPQTQTFGDQLGGQQQVSVGGGGGGDLRTYARQAAQRAGIDPDIFVRQIQQESGFNPNATSPAGAQGIAQFMPATAAGMGVNPNDPYAALDAAARLDAQHLAQYGGDWSKALAAYNAGPGNVDKYGGVPPFEETQRYVSTILGGVKQAVQQGAQNLAQTTGQTLGGALPALSQFGDKQLTAAEAYAACGPAAAVRFAQLMGRQPTLREATDLARQVGWTPDQGLAGLGSESQLFDKMNIPHRMVGADWSALAKEASSGNPVTISTPGHYFTADNYDPSTGAFHVGSSGTDLRGGSEWMTPAQMEARMGALQGGMAVDNPQVPGPSPLASGMSSLLSSGQDLVGQGARRLQDISARLSDLNATPPLAGGALNSAFDRLGSTVSDVVNTQRGLNLSPEQQTNVEARRQERLANGTETPSLTDVLAKVPELVSGGIQGGFNIPGPFGQTQQEADVQAGQDLATTVIGKARDAGWQPTPDQERFAYNTLSQVTPSNVVLSLAFAPAQTVRGALEGLAILGMSAAGAAGGAGLAPNLPEPLQPFAPLVGGLAAPLAGGLAAGAVRGGLRSPGVGAFVRDESGELRLPGEPPVPAESTRMYHGTGSTFERPLPGRFGEEGLYGPGYYLTSDPRIAGGIVRDATVQPENALNQVGAVLKQGYAQAAARAEPPAQLVALQDRWSQEAQQLAEQLRTETDPTTRTQLQGMLDIRRDGLRQIAGDLAQYGGPNVRAVDVPQDLHLFDMERPLTPQQAEDVARALDTVRPGAWDPSDPEVQAEVRSWSTPDADGDSVYQTIVNETGGNKGEANMVLARAGFDGIAHSGGKRVPMFDEAGMPIEHDVNVIFPESLDKLRNAISGTQGGQINPLLAARLGGAAAGGYAGNQTTPDDASPLERALRIGAGATAGGLGVPGLVDLAAVRNPVISQAILENLRAGGLNPSVYPSQGRGLIGTAVDLTKQGMLSNPVTHIANAIGNTIELLRSPAALALGGRPSDAAAGMAAVGRAIPEAAQNAWLALRGNQGATLGQGASTTRPWEPIFRLLGAADMFTRTLGEYQGMAERASQLLREGGLRPSDPAAANFLATHAQELYEAGAQSGGRSVVQTVRDATTGLPFLDNLFHTYSTWKDTLLNSPRLRDQALGALADFQIPFAGVPTRMLQIGLGRLPPITQASGAVRALRALNQGDVVAAQRAIGETALESMLQAQIANGIREGNIVGSDDPDHPGGAVRLLGNWYSFNDLGAYALPMNIMASFADAAEKAGIAQPYTSAWEQKAAQAQAGINASFKPFMQAVPGQQLIHMLAALGQGGATGGAMGAAQQELQDTLNRIAAPGAGKFIEDLMDPVARDVQKQGVHALWEGTQSRIPGLAELLPAKIDPTTGQAMEKRRTGPGMLVGQENPDVESAITQEANRLKTEGYKISAPKTYPQSVTIAGAEVKLSPDEQRAVTRITGQLLGSFEGRLASPGYQQLSDDRKALQMQAFLNAADRARASAAAQVLGRQELRARIQQGQRVAGRLVTAGAPEDFNFPFLSSSGLSADEQRTAFLRSIGAA